MIRRELRGNLGSPTRQSERNSQEHWHWHCLKRRCAASMVLCQDIETQQAFGLGGSFGPRDQVLGQPSLLESLQHPASVCGCCCGDTGRRCPFLAKSEGLQGRVGFLPMGVRPQRQEGPCGWRAQLAGGRASSHALKEQWQSTGGH